eukprot:TRINITY_DN33583_c0_g1_i1.p1 TRINITY_DN33583_c0_g1~~TRINITY_DN33583_c0_g1_i1.p1  ORF type:complete len:326 (+),score=48.11 TRINITY_DN33583_c0_g1_i1:115-1092(+)
MGGVSLVSRARHCVAHIVRAGRPRGLSGAAAGRLPSSDIEGVAAYMAECRDIVVMVGAGVSVSAGIPDFRTPGTGLYDNLKQYNLPYPEAIFDLDFFRKTPQPFYTLCRELWPGQHKPTPTHYFLALLERKGMLRRCFTQNIDSLEAQAGLPAEKIVAAHGNFDSASCIRSHKKVDVDEVREAVFAGKDACLALGKKYGGLVKPDIVFFGEDLPRRFFQLSSEDLPQADLLLVMGTSLQVQPFAGLVNQVLPEVPRVLVNRDRVGEADAAGGDDFMRLFNTSSAGFRFDDPGTRDVFLEGNCDDGISQLCSLLGWEAELSDMMSA